MVRSRPPRAAMLALMLAGTPWTAERVMAQDPPEQRDQAPTLPERAGKAATRPLRDLNILSAPVPDKLEAVMLAPYATAGLDSCTAIASEVAVLNALLPPDAGTADEPDETGVAETLIDVGGDIIAGLIPFRRVVRRVSGASAADARRERALDAGLTRRGFLKGLGQARGCTPPAAPEPPRIRYEFGL